MHLDIYKNAQEYIYLFIYIFIIYASRYIVSCSMSSNRNIQRIYIIFEFYIYIVFYYFIYIYIINASRYIVSCSIFVEIFE